MRAHTRFRGFTLIELIMVLVLAGVLAIVLVPRLSSKVFDARGFHDETLAMLRYAQKTAIAQRRTVCISFGAASVSLTVVGTAGGTTCPGGAMIGPRGESPAQASGRTGVAYVAQPADFYFDSLGQPSGSRSIEVSGDGTALGRTITVEAGTGYVHD